MTLIFADTIFAEHVTPQGHPERQARMEAVGRALDRPEISALDTREAPPAAHEAIIRAHPEAFVEGVKARVPSDGFHSLDPDTHMSPKSWQAAERASGAVIAAIDAVVGGSAPNAFVAARPPGHHAERHRAMGFCLINHIAIGARHAKAHHGLGRVAIVDFDVHHGNGTQDIFYEDGSVLYVSTHQSPLYPGTGMPDERGVGNIVNIPFAAGIDGRRYRPVFRDVVVSAVRAFQPELILLSSGFDAHHDDPLGGMALTEDDFVWITEEMMGVADALCGGRLVSLLEGGYDLGALERSVAAHVMTLAKV